MDLRAFAWFLRLCLLQSCYKGVPLWTPPEFTRDSASPLWTCHCFGRGRLQAMMVSLCGAEKQNLLFSFSQGCPWDCVDCTISLTKVEFNTRVVLPWCMFLWKHQYNTLLYCREQASPCKNMCAVFLYLGRPWFWTFPNFGDVCYKVYFKNGAVLLSASCKIWFICMEHASLCSCFPQCSARRLKSFLLCLCQFNSSCSKSVFLAYCMQ